MATELDVSLNRIMDALSAPEQPFATVMVERRGQNMPAFKHAPPSLAHFFAHYCAEHRDKPFLVDGDLRLSFGDTWQAARAVAAGLITRHGVTRGQRVAIAAHNSANWLIAYMGIIMAGGCATLLNGFWQREELALGLRLVGASLVLVDETRRKRLEGADHDAKIISFSHGYAPETGLAELWGEADSVTLPELGPDDLATILYTSGSTGTSKGALSDHFGVLQGTISYVAQSAMAFAYLDSKGQAPNLQPCTLIAIPLFHVTGEIPVFLQSFAIGRKLVLMPRWDAREAMRLMEAEKVTYFVGVPLMSYEMAAHPDRDKFDLGACITFAAGGAPRPPEHVARIYEAFPHGFPILGYGLTETNAVGSGNLNENYIAKPGSTGPASRPIVTFAILDDAGNHLPQGATGEVSIRTAANFLGYWGDEKATKAAFTADAFFRTGDLGYLDEDGYLFIVDRKKDIIIRGGENISCIEVEDAIYSHDNIMECTVFAVDDEHYGEVPAAVYVTRDGTGPEPEELRAYLGKHLAAFKVPVHLWQSRAELLRLGTQKIDKRAVREQYCKTQENR